VARPAQCTPTGEKTTRCGEPCGELKFYKNGTLLGFHFFGSTPHQEDGNLYSGFLLVFEFPCEFPET
jgi:hypothetical protein